MNTVNHRRPDYGVDAPGIIRNCFLVFALALGGAWMVMVYGHRTWLQAIAWLLAVLALAALSFGCMMVLYALAGKPRVRDLMLARIPWQGSEAVLDVGVGRGLLAVGAAKRLTTGRVTGTDIWNPGDLSGNGPGAAKTNASLEGVADRVEVLTADIRRTGLPDATFDVIVSLLCLHNIEGSDEQAQACAEIARLLKSGGLVMIADYVPTHAYARALASAGLTVTESRSFFRTAISLMWIVTARRDAESLSEV